MVGQVTSSVCFPWGGSPSLEVSAFAPGVAAVLSVTRGLPQSEGLCTMAASCGFAPWPARAPSTSSSAHWHRQHAQRWPRRQLSWRSVLSLPQEQSHTHKGALHSPPALYVSKPHTNYLSLQVPFDLLGFWSISSCALQISIHWNVDGDPTTHWDNNTLQQKTALPFQAFPPEHFSPCFQDLSSPKNPQAFFFHGSILF